MPAIELDPPLDLLKQWLMIPVYCAMYPGLQLKQREPSVLYTVPCQILSKYGIFQVQTPLSLTKF